MKKRRSHKNPFPKSYKAKGLKLYQYVLNDPFIYQKILRPVIDRLAEDLKRGTFNKRKWLRAFLHVVKVASKHYTAVYGRPKGRETAFPYFSKIVAAAKLASYFWQHAVSKRK